MLLGQNLTPNHPQRIREACGSTTLLASMGLNTSLWAKGRKWQRKEGKRLEKLTDVNSFGGATLSRVPPQGVLCTEESGCLNEK